MYLIDKLGLSDEKIINNAALSKYKGGMANDCCFLFCEGEYMGACGEVPNQLYCSSAEIPDENCEWMEGSCTQCI